MKNTAELKAIVNAATITNQWEGDARFTFVSTEAPRDLRNLCKGLRDRNVGVTVVAEPYSLKVGSASLSDFMANG